MSIQNSQQQQPNYDHLFKLVLIGDSGVGKSSLLLRFADSTFTQNYISTIGVDFRFRSVKLKTKEKTLNIKLQIWDTAGQERFRTITSAYYRSADAIVLCFDLTEKESLEHVTQWLSEVQKYAGNDVVILIVGNKLDLFKEVEDPEKRSNFCSKEEINKFFLAYKDLDFLRTSAKSGENVEEAFTKIATKLVLKKEKRLPKKHVPKPQEKTINLNQLNERLGLNNDQGCC
eukprot:maker-scaffold_53-snap-gene-1.0-mRNA-1 protein AED:0.02 eAED:0.02 QI:71/1/1/1/1/1/2/58/229